ncbi:MAG TPA: hypothetical protein VGF73_02050 [Chthoniobacterales bacterium]
MHEDVKREVQSAEQFDDRDSLLVVAARERKATLQAALQKLSEDQREATDELRYVGSRRMDAILGRRARNPLDHDIPYDDRRRGRSTDR